MNWWQSIIIGIVEGLTEYLPVSSTGHILLAQRLLGLEDSEASKAFAIVVQAGAILAVLGLYFTKARSMLDGVMGRNPNGLLLLRNVLIAIGNSGDSALIPHARRLLQDPSAIVRGAAIWALRRLLPDTDASQLRATHEAGETDADVKSEWTAELTRPL